MKPFYVFLKTSVFLLGRIYFRRHRILNAPKQFNAPRIQMSNHPSAFMDPIMIGAEVRMSIHYMVRGDVFKKWLLPVFSGAQMIPIYRTKEDGADSADKNVSSFDKVKDLLLRGKAILFFAEGYTDNVFVRALKPIKKGPARVAFEAMEKCNWSCPLYMQAIGINYSNPRKMRSEILYCYSALVDVHDYKEMYEQNPAQAITALTRRMQELMQEQIVHGKTQTVVDFSENICRITRKGLHNENSHSGITIEKRFRYAQDLSKKLNESLDEQDKLPENYQKLADKMHIYFEDQHSDGINENWVYYKNTSSSIRLYSALYLIFGLPFAIIGAVHGLIPYIIVKQFVERNFKRPVFWSGAKLGLGWVVFALFNVAAIPLFYHFVFPSWWLAVAYYFIAIPGSFIAFHIYKRKLKEAFQRLSASEKEIKAYAERRKEIENELAELGLS